MKRIFIYGAGKYGNLLYGCLNDVGVKVDSFVQTELVINDMSKKVSTISFAELKNIDEEKIIFVAIKNANVAREIEHNIYKYCSNSVVYNCGSFIEENLIRRRVRNILGDKYCIICNNQVDKFEPVGIEEEIFNRLHIIGGGYRENAVCSNCGCIDRERWLYYVIKNKTDISTLSGRILHFAPEESISDYIKNNDEVDYYTADVVLGRAMHVTDITNMQYKDETFDYVICNHVMEHIIDEEKAVEEVKRVLKENGKWIFSFPICMEIKTYEDSSIISPEERLKAYGQADHVRLYGYDYKERFEKYGLKLEVYSPQDEITDEELKKYGYIKEDVIIIASKNA